MPSPVTIYIDADACPVKQEIYRVAERHALKGVALKVFVVRKSPIAVPRCKDAVAATWPDLFRPSTSFLSSTSLVGWTLKAWMPATSAGMTPWRASSSGVPVRYENVMAGLVPAIHVFLRNAGSGALRLQAPARHCVRRACRKDHPIPDSRRESSGPSRRAASA
jgi:hypothetical protein